jgi:pimeloyl-ACP methyl ester carboxylesterase
MFAVVTHHTEAGSGPAVLLVHGWPTSSFLWRDVMKPIARTHRAIAIDLPGFGASEKPPDATYDFDFFEAAIDAKLAELGVEETAVVGHDIGGPIALHWALRNPARVTKVALLNTLVYPELSEAARQFVHACTTPGLREQLTSDDGLALAMRIGVADPDALGDDVVAGVTAPFQTEEDRLALAKAGVGLDLEEVARMERELPSLKVPLRVIYGEQDRILPDIADTVARLRRDVPHAEVTALPHCGHFLQEEDPEQVGELLAAFLR